MAGSTKHRQHGTRPGHELPGPQSVYEPITDRRSTAAGSGRQFRPRCNGQTALPAKRRARSVCSWKRSARSVTRALRKWATRLAPLLTVIKTAGSPGQQTLTYHSPSVSDWCGSIVSISVLTIPCCLSTCALRPNGVISYSTSLKFNDREVASPASTSRSAPCRGRPSEIRAVPPLQFNSSRSR